MGHERKGRSKVTAFVCGLVVVGILSATASGTAATAGDPLRATWLAALHADLKKYPAITRAALIRVQRKPLFIQVIYVSGAIGGRYSRNLCTIAEVDPAGFNVSARRVIFRTTNDYRYVRSQGFSVNYVLLMYRRGYIFGCGF
jgi:hypothetical protein